MSVSRRNGVKLLRYTTWAGPTRYMTGAMTSKNETLYTQWVQYDLVTSAFRCAI